MIVCLLNICQWDWTDWSLPACNASNNEMPKSHQQVVVATMAVHSASNDAPQSVTLNASPRRLASHHGTMREAADNEDDEDYKQIIEWWLTLELLLVVPGLLRRITDMRRRCAAAAAAQIRISAVDDEHIAEASIPLSLSRANPSAACDFVVPINPSVCCNDVYLLYRLEAATVL